MKNYLSLTKLPKVIFYNYLKLEISFTFINNEIYTS